MSGSRRRLSPEQRRSQLLDIGAQMFGTRPYEEVLIEDVAAAAGVSRALMYHYFPGKREFFTAIFKRDSDQLLATIQIDPALPLTAQVHAGLEAHMDFCIAHQRTILIASRGALSGDPTIQTIISEELAVLHTRLLRAVQAHAHSRQIDSLAVHGWLAFVRAVCIEWLEHDHVSREKIHQLCYHALAGIFGGRLDLDSPLEGPDDSAIPQTT